jgi:hypothetical protein
MRAFRFYLPVLCIDDTFLTRKYKVQIVISIGMDEDHQILPVAFAFMENENTNSWYWFLKHVKGQVVGSRPDVCLISDRHYDILAAI